MQQPIWLILCLTLLGCEKDPIGKSPTNNPDVNVLFMFEHEGIKVYRFYDNGMAIYYTDARGKTAWTQHHGKSSSPVGVETVGDANQ
jgi:hypothetical protein